MTEFFLSTLRHNVIHFALKKRNNQRRITKLLRTWNRNVPAPNRLRRVGPTPAELSRRRVGGAELTAPIWHRRIGGAELSQSGRRHLGFCRKKICKISFRYLLFGIMLLSSVHLSVTLCIVALRVGVRVDSCTIVCLAMHFLFTSSDTFSAGCILQPQHTAKNRTTEISASGTAMGSVVTWPSGTHYLTNLKIRRVVLLTVLNSSLRQSCSVSTNVTSALEVFLKTICAI